MKIRKVAVGNAAEAFIEGNFTNGVNIISSDDLFCPHNTHSGDLVLRFAEFFHTFRMRDSTHSCLPPDAGSRRIV